jgi:hypothetical protein
MPAARRCAGLDSNSKQVSSYVLSPEQFDVGVGSMRGFRLLACRGILALGAIAAGPVRTLGAVDFERDVQPILREREGSEKSEVRSEKSEVKSDEERGAEVTVPCSLFPVPCSPFLFPVPRSSHSFHDGRDSLP